MRTSGTKPPYRYSAFLSYSHKDGKWGEWLHRALERYRVPRALVGRETPAGKVPRSLRPVFRDRDELPSSSTLGDRIRERLAASRHLIVLCSPNAAASRWVNEEVQTFKQTGAGERIHGFIVDGEPFASERPELGLLECFPPALRSRVGAAGELTGERDEPGAADARAHADGASRALIRLIAGVIGVEFDELWRRERRRRRRNILIATTLAVIAGAAAITTWHRVAKDRATAVSRSSVRDALLSLDAGALPLGLAQFARAVRADPDSGIARSMAIAALQYATRGLPRITVSHQDVPEWGEFSADGRMLITAGQDGARLWDARTGEALSAGPLTHQNAVFSARFSPWGGLLVTGSVDGTARLWRVDGGIPLLVPWLHLTPPFRLGVSARDVILETEFSSDGHAVLTVTEDGAIHQWDAHIGGESSTPISIGGHVVSAHFSRDGRRLLVVRSDGRASVWDAATAALQRSVGDAAAPVLALADSANGVLALRSPKAHQLEIVRIEPVARRVARVAETSAPAQATFGGGGTKAVVVSTDGSARVWDFTAAPSYAPRLRQDAPILDAQLNPQADRVLTRAKDDTVRVWDAATADPLTPVLEHPDVLASARFAPDGRHFVTLAFDNLARIWDSRSGLRLARAMPINAVASRLVAEFSPAGDRAVYTLDDGSAQLVDTTRWAPVREPLQLHGRLAAAEFSRDGKLLVTASADGVARVWDAMTGARLTSVHDSRAPLKDARFSPNGEYVVTASEDGTAQVWVSRTGRAVGAAMQHTGFRRAVETAQFSPDGRSIVTACADGSARIWNAETGVEIWRAVFNEDVDSTWLNAAAFSSDGTRLVTVAGIDVGTPLTGWMQVWDAKTHAPIGARQREAGAVVLARFSPDGTVIATASENGNTRLWDAASGAPLGRVMKQGGAVTALDFSPDGQRLVTASEDGTAAVWDGQTGRRVGVSLPHGDSVVSARFSADGQTVMTASTDGQIRVWDTTAGDAADAERLANLLEAIGGGYLDDLGGLVPRTDRAAALRRVVATADAAPESAFNQFISWLLDSKSRDYVQNTAQ